MALQRGFLGIEARRITLRRQLLRCLCTHRPYFIPTPRSGEGGPSEARRAMDGGRGAPSAMLRSLARATHESPSPAGGRKANRSRGACCVRVMCTTKASLRGAMATKQSGSDDWLREITTVFDLDCFASLAMTKDNDEKKKGSGTPANVFLKPPHLAMRRAPFSNKPPPLWGRVRRGHARLTAFHHGSCRWGVAPWAQLQARLPGTWRDVRSGKLAPTGGRRPRALTRVLPAPACPSPGMHLPDRS